MAERSSALEHDFDTVDVSFFGVEESAPSKSKKAVERRQFFKDFSFRQVGSICKYIEPVSAAQPIEYVLNVFDENPDIQAVPIEEYNVVVGYIDRATLAAATRGHIARFFLKETADYVKRVPLVIYAKEFCEQCLAKVSATAKNVRASYFPVFNYHKSFYGLLELDDLIARIDEIREKDLEMARAIQQEIMPDAESLNSLPFSVRAWNRMANPIGGDLYSVCKISEKEYLAGCFDVSGKNVAAALVTVALASFFAGLKMTPQIAKSPQQIIANLDRFIENIVPLGTFVTAGVFFIDIEAKRLSVFNCGHTVIYFFAPGASSNGKRIVKVSEVEAFLPPLGLGVVAEALEGGAVDVPSCAIKKGLRAELYSDGLEDMQTEEGIRYGCDRVKSLFKLLYPVKREEFAQKLEEAVLKWTERAMLSDDITVVDVRF